MCVAAIGLALTAASTVMSIVGQRQASKAEEQAARYREQVARVNAEARRRDAARALADTRAEKDKALATKGAQGQAKVDFAARGVVVNQGSPQQIHGDIASAGAIDIARIREEKQIRARNLEIDALNFENEGNLLSAQADNISAAKNTDTLGTLLAGGSKIFAQGSANKKATGSFFGV